MMLPWTFSTALAITLLVGLTTYINVRRPPTSLMHGLALLFGSALVFSVGDLIANQWSEDQYALVRWIGMIMVYTGLLGIAPAWWLFTRKFSEYVGEERVAPKFNLKYLVALNVLLWIGLVTNPWHGQFLMEIHPSARSSYGPLWYVTAILNYTVVLVAMWHHWRASLRAADPDVRSQFRHLTAAAAIPTILNVVYVGNPEPFTYDPTALGFAMSCALFLYAVERRNLFGLERVSLPRILNHDADAILIVSLHHSLQWANPAADALFGPGQIVTGQAVEDLLAQAVPSFSLSDASEESSGIDFEEHRFVSSRGEVKWVVIEVTPVNHGPLSGPAGLCLRLRDQTALRAKTREVEQKILLIDGLSEAVGEGIVIFDSNGQFRHVNRAFFRLFDVSEEARRAGPKAVAEAVEKMLKQGGPKVRAFMEGLNHRSAGEFDKDHSGAGDFGLTDGRILKIETFPIETNQGFRGRAWRFTDVTNERNETRVMLQAQKLEGLGHMAGNIAHDFNNILVAILGNAELAREELSPDSPAHPPLAEVESAAVRASDLTGQLLAYAGKIVVAQEDLDLSSLVLEATQLISVAIPKNIEKIFDLDHDLPLVRGGAAELRQVVMNLLSNAADAIQDDDWGTITIETGLGEPRRLPDADAFLEHGQAQQPTVYLCVRDNGCGMDQGTLEKIFEPFFSTKFTQGGHGLGLAATRGILDSHKGSLLRIETKVNEGTTFSVMLPVGQTAGKADVPSAPEDVRHGFSGYRVLVIDDEAAIRSLLTKRLQAADFEVETAEDGEAGLELLEKANPSVDLVILDLTMPGLSGIETHARMRRDHPELPILLSSGHPPEEALPAIRNGHEKDGHSAYIQKPYRSAALLEKIEHLLADRPGAAMDSSVS